MTSLPHENGPDSEDVTMLSTPSPLKTLANQVMALEAGKTHTDTLLEKVIERLDQFEVLISQLGLRPRSPWPDRILLASILLALLLR